MPNDKDTLEEIKKALAAATPGPWDWYEDEAEVVNSDGMSVCQLWWKDGKPRPHDDCVPDGILIANAPEWLRYLLEQYEQQQLEIADLKKAYDEVLQSSRNLLHECEMTNKQLRQSREENERIANEIKSHGPEGRNYTNQQYVELLLKYDQLQTENTHLRGLYERERAIADSADEKLERAQSELTEWQERVRKSNLSYEGLFNELKQVKAERDDYRKVLEWYADIDAYTVIHLGCSPMVMSDRGKLACDILSRYEKGESHEQEAPSDMG